MNRIVRLALLVFFALGCYAQNTLVYNPFTRKLDYTGSGGGGSGTVSNCAAVGSLGYYSASGTTITCVGADYIFNTHTLTLAATAIFDAAANSAQVKVVTKSQADNSTNAASTAYVDTGLATKVAKFFGTAAPGSVAGNLPGDIYSDTTNHVLYWCNAPSATAAPACTSVTSGGWTAVNGSFASSVDATKFGAVCDGSTDDTAAFTAMSALAVNIYIPAAKTCSILNPTWSSHTHIWGGPNSGLIRGAGTTGSYMLTASSKTDVGLHNLIIDGNSVTQTTANLYYIFLTGTSNWVVENCTFQNTGSPPASMGGITEFNGSGVIRSNTFKSTILGQQINVDSNSTATNRVQILNNSLNGSTTGGIWVQNSGSEGVCPVEVAGNLISSIGDSAADAGQTGNAIKVYQCDYADVHDNTTDTTRYAGVRVTTSSWNDIHDNTIKAASKTAIYCSELGGANNHCHGNHIFNSMSGIDATNVSSRSPDATNKIDNNDCTNVSYYCVYGEHDVVANNRADGVPFPFIIGHGATSHDNVLKSNFCTLSSASYYPVDVCAGIDVGMLGNNTVFGNLYGGSTAITVTTMMATNTPSNIVVTAITQASPAAVTYSSGTQPANNSTVCFAQVAGMIQINGLCGLVSSSTGTTFSVAINASAFSAFLATPANGTSPHAQAIEVYSSGTTPYQSFTTYVSVPQLNVRDFGATGNGSTDDTTAIQNTINAMPASGGRVFFPCGTYLVSSTLTTGTKSSFFLEGQGSGSWQNATFQCAKITTATALTSILSLGNGTNQLTGGVVQGLSFTDSVGNNVTNGIYVSDSYTTIRNSDFQGMKTCVEYDGGAYFQNGNRFENNQCRNVNNDVLVNGLSDGPLLSKNYFTTNGTQPGNVCITIQSSNTATSVKSVDDNCVVNSAAVSSGTISGCTRTASATAVCTTSGSLPASFVSNGFVTVAGMTPSTYNATNALVTVTGANTFTYLTGTNTTDSTSVQGTASEIYAVGVLINNSHDNIFTGLKVEMASANLGSCVEVQTGANRNQFNFACSKGVNAVTLDSGALGVTGSYSVGNTTNTDPVDNSGSASDWLFDIVTTTTAYRQAAGGAKYFAGTAFPPAGQCTAATLGGIYSRNNGGTGTIYACTSPATWTALATGGSGVGPNGVNAQTVSYLLVGGDNSKLVIENGSNLTATLPASPPSATWTAAILNLNSTPLTVARNGLNINGVAANLTLQQSQQVSIWTDGSNYFLGDTNYGVNTGVTLTCTAQSCVFALDTAYANTNYKNLAGAVDYAAGGGTAQAQTASYAASLTALFSGLELCWLPTAANTGAGPTFSPNSLTAHTVVKQAGAALVANDLITTAVACARYDATGTQWELQNPQTSASGTPSFPLTVTGTVTSGGIPYFSSTTQESSSGILNTNVLVKGGGAGGAPTNSSVIDNGTTVTSTDTGGYVAPVFVANGATAGFVDFPQGSTSAAVAPCNTATSICEQAPTAVTSYLITKPGAAPTNNFSSKTTTTAGVESFNKMHQTVVLTGSAYTNATTTFSNVSSTTNLAFSLDASTAYGGTCYLVYSASAATAGPKIEFTGPGSPTAVLYSAAFQLTATPTYADSAAATAFSSSLTGGAAVTATTNLAVRIQFGIVNGTNAGTLQLLAAANGSGTLTIQPGSYCQMQ